MKDTDIYAATGKSRLIDRLKVPKVWDKTNLVCPRKRLILAVLLYRQQYKNNARYRTISDVAKSLGWCRKTVRRNLAELLEWKYVVEQDGQYDPVRRSNYTPLNTGGKDWWADYAWDWLGADQYADCTEQYVLKVKSEYPNVGTPRIAALCGVSRRRVRDIVDGDGTLKKSTKTSKTSKTTKKEPTMFEPSVSEPSSDIEAKQVHAKKKIASTEKRLAEKPVTIDKMAVLSGVVDRYWVTAVCPERWNELCPDEDRTCYPVTADTRQWYHETYGTIRQCG